MTSGCAYQLLRPSQRVAFSSWASRSSSAQTSAMRPEMMRRPVDAGGAVSSSSRSTRTRPVHGRGWVVFRPFALSALALEPIAVGVQSAAGWACGPFANGSASWAGPPGAGCDCAACGLEPPCSGTNHEAKACTGAKITERVGECEKLAIPMINSLLRAQAGFRLDRGPGGRCNRVLTMHGQTPATCCTTAIST